MAGHLASLSLAQRRFLNFLTNLSNLKVNKKYPKQRAPNRKSNRSLLELTPSGLEIPSYSITLAEVLVLKQFKKWTSESFALDDATPTINANF